MSSSIKCNNNLKNHLNDWIFHYNPHRDTWEAVERDNYRELFSGDRGNVLRSDCLDTLVEIINRKLYKTL